MCLNLKPNIYLLNIIKESWNLIDLSVFIKIKGILYVYIKFISG